MNRKGVSAVIGTVLLLALVIAMTVVIWVVISGVVGEASEDISLGRVSLDLKILGVNYQGEDLVVNVRRDKGKGTLKGIKFLVEGVDGAEELVERGIDLDEYESNQFILDDLEMDVSNVVSVSVVPVLPSGSAEIRDVWKKGSADISEVTESVDDTSGDTIELGCSSHFECNDGKACTEDTCTEEGDCSNVDSDALCEDGEICSVGICETAPECSVDPDCDNGLFCDGLETCSAGSCQSGTAPSCDDSLTCTLDSCNEGTDSCDNVDTDALCTLGQVCNAGVCEVPPCVPDCSNAFNICAGVLFSNGCNPTIGCTGTKGPSCPSASTVNCGVSITSTNGCGTCFGKGTKCSSGTCNAVTGQCVVLLSCSAQGKDCCSDQGSCIDGKGPYPASDCSTCCNNYECWEDY